MLDWIIPIVTCYAIFDLITSAVLNDLDHEKHVSIAGGFLWPLFLLAAIIRGTVDYFRGR